jgi:membrane-bound lytic murein transglycosylase D
MRSILQALVPCLVLPLVLFLLLAAPVIEAEVDRRLPLVPAYDLSRQLAAEVAATESRVDGLPPNYGLILEQYGSLENDMRLKRLAPISAALPKNHFSERLLASFILWNKGLPADFLSSDPVREIGRAIGVARSKEKRSAAMRESILARHRLDCLRIKPREVVATPPARYVLPPDVMPDGLVFCGERIPLERDDVRRRIEDQIDYLLTDLRESTGIWLKRRDRYGEAIKNILESEGLPGEFALLPALESGYDATAVSQSQARGWWQFVKTTAKGSLAKDPSLDWTLRVDQWNDDRCDLDLSTRAAARYLKWMRSRIFGSVDRGSWLTTAAAYNAGLAEIQYRIGAFKTGTYWDMKLPLETEDYVPRWIAFAVIDSHRKHYGMEPPGTAVLGFDTLRGVRLARDLPLAFIAAATKSSLRFLKELNGGLQSRRLLYRAAADNKGRGYTIHIPRGSKDAVLKALRRGSYLETGSSEDQP